MGWDASLSEQVLAFSIAHPARLSKQVFERGVPMVSRQVGNWWPGVSGRLTGVQLCTGSAKVTGPFPFLLAHMGWTGIIV